MGNPIILRFPFDDPEKPEVIEVLTNVPSNWRKYLKKKAKKIKKRGKYMVTNILYGDDYRYYYPESMKKKYEKIEKESK